MSATFHAVGWVDVRIKIDNTYDASQSATAEYIADLVKMRIETSIANCEVVNHLLQIEKIG